MPCAEGDISDCQPEANSIEGLKSYLSPSTQGMTVFITPIVNQSTCNLDRFYTAQSLEHEIVSFAIIRWFVNR